MKIIILLLFIFLHISCKSTNDKLICLQNKNKVWSKQEVYKDMQKQLTDTLLDWINNKNIKRVQYYKKKSWKIDSTVFFNTLQNAAILLIMDQDTSINATMDNIQLIYAKRNGNKWNFYKSGMPTITANRYYTDKKDPTIPYTFEELSDIAKKEIIEGGYFKNNTCDINDSYINDWYTKDLEYLHQKFLNDK